ncbi:MAG: anti-sigma factor family protein [Armatimonadota bacterium]
MECLEDKELEQYITGRASSKDLISIDQHLQTCVCCSERLRKLLAERRALVSFIARVTGIQECPDYNTLSAFLDGKLTEAEARQIRSHLNSCSLCFRDIKQMQLMRAQAEIRGPVAVQPTTAETIGLCLTKIWKPLAVTATLTAAVLAIGLITWTRVTLKPVTTPTETAQTSEHRIEHKRIEHEKDKLLTEAAQSQKQVTAQNTDTQPREPYSKYTVLLEEGNYRLIKRDGKYALVRRDGSPPRNYLETRIAQLVVEKLRTGKIQSGRSNLVALRTLHLRGPDNFVPPPTAPKLLKPTGSIVVEERPLFAWSKVNMAESYRLVVTDTSGKTIYEAITTNTWLKPGIAFKRGETYLWRVGARFSESENWSNSVTGIFRILSSSDLSLIRSTKRLMPGSHLALAVVYESLGLTSEAANEYRLLSAKHADSPVARILTVQ